MPIEPANFFTGCNYWASASGIYMWRRWDAGNVEGDFAALRKTGCRMLRVFPLWPDFQPLTRARGGGNTPGTVLYKDGPLPNGAGVDPEMVERFRTLCHLAEEQGLRLVVGLVTGWMSGRLFVPEALDGLDPLTSAESIQWQVRFVRHMVRELKDEKAISGWDLGNECNCMGRVENHFQAWNWTHAITSAIRLEDRTRPVVSGMHGLKLEERANWRIADQGELTDVLTTHPYPLFTPNCNLDPSDGMRGVLHGVAESLYYAGVSGKPCFIEEAGSLGPGIMSNSRAARLLGGGLRAAWAHNLPGYLWWCAFCQNHLDYLPYESHAMERDLGLLTQDYELRPQAEAMGGFAERLESLPPLPEHKAEVVVLLTRDQDQWSVVYGCFLLAKQAGFDVRFQDAEAELTPSVAYWLPSVTGFLGISRRRYLELLDCVRDGALLVASGFGTLEPFEPFFGVEVDCRYRQPSQLSVSELGVSLSLPLTQRLLVTGGRSLLRDDAGAPVVTSMACGAGECRFVSAPLEQLAGELEGQETSGVWRILRLAFEPVVSARMLGKDNPLLGITEYALDDKHGLAVVMNYGQEAVDVAVEPQNGWRVHGGGEVECALASLDLTVLELERE